MHFVSVHLQYVLLIYSTCVQDNMLMRCILKSLIVVTGKIPQPSAHLTSDSVLIPYSLSNTHKTVAQHSQYTYDVRPVSCPDICVCVFSEVFWCLENNHDKTKSKIFMSHCHNENLSDRVHMVNTEGRNYTDCCPHFTMS